LTRLTKRKVKVGSRVVWVSDPPVIYRAKRPVGTVVDLTRSTIRVNWDAGIEATYKRQRPEIRLVAPLNIVC